MAVQIKTLEYFLFNIGGYFDGYNEIRIQGDLFETSKSKQDYNTILPEPSGRDIITMILATEHNGNWRLNTTKGRPARFCLEVMNILKF